MHMVECFCLYKLYRPLISIIPCYVLYAATFVIVSSSKGVVNSIKESYGEKWCPSFKMHL